MGGRTGQRKKRAFFDWRYVPVESRRSYRLAFILFWSVLLFLLFKRYVISLGILTDRSMLPAMTDGNYFLINRYLYQFRRPARGEVVVVRMPGEDVLYVKRIIAQPGERLSIRGGRVYVNDRLLREPYAVGWTLPDYGPLQLSERHYFVMGDNRQESFDSRHFGPITQEEIEGKIRPGRMFAFY